MTGKTRWRALQPINDPDETRAPVLGLMLTLDYDLPSVGGVSDEKRTKTGPPTYEWTCGDILEGPPTGWYWDAFVESAVSPTAFAPGIDVSRSISHTSEMGTWTFSAEGDYVWRWFAGEPSYSLVFPKSDFTDWVILPAITILLVLATSGTIIVVRKRRRKAR
ncbi:MAG: hypothetical protein BMS9Abin28_1864 [Anaerolineae bacterium]|nr:MAG: hypothetical protein BMS9Abin28_1864 [Anaerolineae bacterium]